MKTKGSAKHDHRIQHKLKAKGGIQERYEFPSRRSDRSPPSAKTPDSLAGSPGTVFFDRGEKGDSFRCYDARYLFETALSNVAELIVVQLYPERGGSGDAYLRLRLRQKIEELEIVDVLKSDFGYSEYDDLGKQLSEFFAVPLRMTETYE